MPPSHRTRCSRWPASQDRVAGARTPSICENRAAAAAERRSQLDKPPVRGIGRAGRAGNTPGGPVKDCRRLARGLGLGLGLGSRIGDRDRGLGGDRDRGLGHQGLGYTSTGRGEGGAGEGDLPVSTSDPPRRRRARPPSPSPLPQLRLLLRVIEHLANAVDLEVLSLRGLVWPHTWCRHPISMPKIIRDGISRAAHTRSRC